MLGLLENLEVDAGLTYTENEPIGKVRTIPLYNESYRLLTSPDAMFGDRKQVTWKEVGQVPLCLLTPDMQNRRIIDRALRSVGAEATPTLTSNSLLVLYTHVKTGRWASVMPAKLAETLGLVGRGPQHSDRRSRRRLQRRTGDPAARPDDALIAAWCRSRAKSRRPGDSAGIKARGFNRRSGLALCLPAASRGSVMRTTVPVPSFERSRIVPPCRLVSDRAMARPSPEP